MQSDNLAEARNDLEAALKIEPDGDTYTALGSVLMLEGKYDDAVKMHKKSIELNRNNYVTWANLGEAYNWSGTQHDKAVQAFGKAIELGEAVHASNLQDPALLVLLANYYALIGNSEKSPVLVRQALALAPGNPSIEYQAGEAYETLGRRADAIPLIAEAVATGHRTYEFHRNPELAALRADPTFEAALQAALQAEKQRKN